MELEVFLSEFSEFGFGFDIKIRLKPYLFFVN